LGLGLGLGLALLLHLVEELVRTLQLLAWVRLGAEGVA